MSEYVRLKMAQYKQPGGPHFAAGPADAVTETNHNDATEHSVPPQILASVSADLSDGPVPLSQFVARTGLESRATAAAAPPAPPPQLRAIQLQKIYRKGQVQIPVLAGVDLEIRQGEMLAVIGQSGSGKSTLLHLLGTLDAPTAGEVHLDGRRIDNLPSTERDALRNTRFGMIFQFYHLLPELTTLENVLAPLMIRFGAWTYWRRRRKLVARAKELLDLVGLAHRLKHRPRELSGGEMQRTAIARALVGGPEILLADEPTGNLDQTTGEEILRILRTLNQTERLSIVMVTHDPAIAAGADRVVRLAGGLVADV